VIGEEYFPRPLNTKESYLRAEILQSLVCVNIAHAKGLINSSVSHTTMRFWEIYKEEIISYWGCEFFPTEYQYPYLCGGWVSDTLLGISLDLINLEKLPYKRYVYAAFKAGQIHPPKIGRKADKKVYQSPYLQIWGNMRIADCLKSHLDVGTQSQIRTKYITFRTNPRKALRAWQDYEKRRKKEFNKWISAPTYESFVDEVIASSATDFYPTSDMIEKHVPMGLYKERREIDPYLSPNPLISAICVENPDKDNTEIPEYYSLLKKSKQSSVLNFSKIDSKSQ
jgi:hypothetical protein